MGGTLVPTSLHPRAKAANLVTHDRRPQRLQTLAHESDSRESRVCICTVCPRLQMLAGEEICRQAIFSRLLRCPRLCDAGAMDEPKETKITPTVSRVSEDIVVELVYDRSARRTGLVVSRGGKWTIEQDIEIDTGERLVPYSATNNLIRHDCVVLPSAPIDHGSKEALVRDIAAYLHRYVDLSPLFERIAAHYVLLTWVYDAFNEVPYLRLKGEYGSGKTRALIALGSIAYKGFFASGASTVSPIFHTLDTFAGTLILDEADLRFSDKTTDLVKILNNGTVKGLPVLRTLQNRHKEFNPAAFNVFGPKIIAMRGTFRDQALESRFLTEEMGVRPLRSDIPIQLPDTLRADALALRNRLLHFRLTNLSAIKSDPTRVISGIDPRLNQTALSLLSLVDDRDLGEGISAMLRAKQTQIAADRARSVEARTITALIEAFQDAELAALPLSDIAERVNAIGDGLDEPVSPRQVGQVLRARSVPLRKSNGTIVVPRSAFEGSEANLDRQA